MTETISTGSGETAAPSWPNRGRGEGGARPGAPFHRRDLLLALLPPLVLALLVARWGVDLPYFDQWELVPRFQAWRDGAFPWRQVWQLHNEHRLLLPELILLGLGRLSDWNIRLELALNLLLAALLCAVLAGRLRATLEGDRRLSFLLPLFSLLLFSPSQWGNWSWGWQIQIFLVLLLVATAIDLLAREPRTPARFAGAVACAVAASFSFANGLLLFPLGLPLVLAPSRRRAAYGAVWVAAGALVYWIYGVARIGNRFRPEGENPWERLYLQAKYLLFYLAGPLLNEPRAVWLIAHLVVPASFLLVAALAWREGKELWRPLLPWATLAAFGLASAAMTAYGRYTFGIGQALSSRYFSIANFYWLGLLGMAAVWLRRRHPQRLPRSVAPAAAVLALALLAGAILGGRDFRADSLERQRLRAVLRGERAAEGDVATQVPYPDPEIVRQRIAQLEQLRLSLFREERRKPDAGALPAQP